MGDWVLRTDGGARGNPGPAAAAFILEDPVGTVVASGARFLGQVTNNVAEYEGLILGLEAAAEEGVTSLDVLSDSELVVRQLNGDYRVKDDRLKELHAQAAQRIEGFERVTITHVRRQENSAADALVNQAIDASQADTRAPHPGLDGCWELTVKDHFDAAHTLVGYPGECSDLHGHTWDVEVTVRGEVLDAVGIVYDFKRLKDDLASVLASLDHAYLNEVEPFDTLNPTAENLARHLCESLQRRVASQVRVVEVAVWESPIARIVFKPRSK